MKLKLLIPLLLLFAACTTDKPMTEEQKAAIQEEAAAAVKTYFNSMTVSDAKTLTGMLENSTDLTYIAAGMIYDYARMMELAEVNLPYIKGTDLCKPNLKNNSHCQPGMFHLYMVR